MSIIIDIILQVRVYIFIMEIIPYLRIATAITLKEARVNAGIYQYQLADFSGLSCSYIAAVKA